VLTDRRASIFPRLKAPEPFLLDVVLAYDGAIAATALLLLRTLPLGYNW